MSLPEPVAQGTAYPQSESVVQAPSHSRGSFGPVFVVLSVIIVVAMLACFLGRLFTRRFANLNSRLSNRAPRRSADIEDSFEISLSSPPAGRRGERMGPGPGGRKETKVAAQNGEIRAEGKNGGPNSSSA